MSLDILNYRGERASVFELISGSIVNFVTHHLVMTASVVLALT